MSELKVEFKTMRRIEDTKVGGGKRFGSLDQSLRDLSSSPGSVDEKRLMTKHLGYLTWITVYDL